MLKKRFRIERTRLQRQSVLGRKSWKSCTTAMRLWSKLETLNITTLFQGPAKRNIYSFDKGWHFKVNSKDSCREHNIMNLQRNAFAIHRTQRTQRSNQDFGHEIRCIATYEKHQNGERVFHQESKTSAECSSEHHFLQSLKCNWFTKFLWIHWKCSTTDYNMIPSLKRRTD